jgi:Amt family ammonium transporter
MPAADLAWMLAAFALVLLMFPGLALFYGGMTKGRNALNMFMMVMGSMAITAVVYVAFGHGLVVGDSIGGLGLIGNPLEYAGWNAFTADDGSDSAYWGAFYTLFAAISIGIVASGAAGRMRFGSWLAFSALWVVLVYAPLAHWVFAFSDEESGIVGGWMRNVLGLHDYAGGTAVHMNAGASALALAAVLGPRRTSHGRPHNISLVLLGAGMLFVGWIGFNGGTAAGANFLAGYVIFTTLLAALGGGLGFALIEHYRDGQATMLGFASGLIAGLVGITPTADAVTPLASLPLGLICGAVVAWAITWLRRRKVDDALDAFAVHGIGGIVGTYLAVLFASSAAPAGLTGVVFGGDPLLALTETIAIAVTLAYSFGVTYAIAWVMNKIRPIRVSAKQEAIGLDRTLHAETAYDFDRI